MSSKRYIEIMSGTGRPKVIDDLYELAREYRNSSGFLTGFGDEVINVADRLSRRWKEEALKDYIERLEVEADSYRYMAEQAQKMYCEFRAKTEGNRTKEEVATFHGWSCYEKEKSQKALEELSRLDEELGLI